MWQRPRDQHPVGLKAPQEIYLRRKQSDWALRCERRRGWGHARGKRARCSGNPLSQDSTNRKREINTRVKLINKCPVFCWYVGADKSSNYKTGKAVHIRSDEKKESTGIAPSTFRKHCKYQSVTTRRYMHILTRRIDPTFIPHEKIGIALYSKRSSRSNVVQWNVESAFSWKTVAI